MAKLKRPVMQTYTVTDVVKGPDPYAGIPYSRIRGEGAIKATHPALKVPGTGSMHWDPQLERWVV